MVATACGGPWSVLMLPSEDVRQTLPSRVAHATDACVQPHTYESGSLGLILAPVCF